MQLWGSTTTGPMWPLGIFNRTGMISVLNPWADVRIPIYVLITFVSMTQRDRRNRTSSQTTECCVYCLKSAFFKNPFGLSRARQGANTPINLRNTLRRGKLNTVKDLSFEAVRILPWKVAREVLNPRYDSCTILHDYFNIKFL